MRAMFFSSGTVAVDVTSWLSHTVISLVGVSRSGVRVSPVAHPPSRDTRGDPPDGEGWPYHNGRYLGRSPFRIREVEMEWKHLTTRAGSTGLPLSAPRHSFVVLLSKFWRLVLPLMCCLLFLSFSLLLFLLLFSRMWSLSLHHKRLHYSLCKRREFLALDNGDPDTSPTLTRLHDNLHPSHLAITSAVCLSVSPQGLSGRGLKHCDSEQRTANSEQQTPLLPHTFIHAGMIR